MGCHVLLAEDDDDLRQSLAGILMREGYRAQTFKSGVAALASLRTQKPDVVVLDLNVRDMDVQEFLRHQSADPLISSVPVVLISGRSAPQLNRPVVGTLKKPFGLQEFIQAVNEGCG